MFELLRAPTMKPSELWDLDTSTSGPGSAWPRRWVNAVAITGDGRRAVSGAYNGTLKIWDPATGIEIHGMTIDGGAFVLSRLAAAW